MSNELSAQFDNFVDKLLSPSAIDQLGANLEAGKDFIRSWAAVNIAPLIASERLDAATLRHSAAIQTAEAVALRDRIVLVNPANPIAHNVTRALEIVVQTKDSNAAFLRQLADYADFRALANTERMAMALYAAKQLGAMAGLIDISLRAEVAVNSGEWEPVGETSIGVLTGLGIGLGVTGLAAGLPVLLGLAISIAFGYAGAKMGEAFLWPLIKDVSRMIPDPFWDKVFSTFDGVSNFVSDLFLAARNWTAPRDPLVLDLDGDGLETTGITGHSPILFDHDHDGDGVRTGTGWIKPDDGLLVLDLNGNGVIDSGRELFGDQTLLPNGQKAADGYAALAVHDANHDGRISSADAVYSQLRVWQDANQDGISQAGELRTLAELGIASIGVAGTANNINLGNGNTQPWSGSYTRTDGSTGASGVAEVSGSLLLAGNNFYREFPDDPVVTAAAAALPQMGGSGWVLRKLRTCHYRQSKKIAARAGWTCAGGRKHSGSLQHKHRACRIRPESAALAVLCF